MRVKISTNSPLPPLRAWFPLSPRHGETIFTFKSLLCTSLSVLHDISPASLRLSLDGFELLNLCELSMVRDGDLISVDVCEVPVSVNATAQAQTVDQSAVHASSPRPRTKPTSGPSVLRKRKRSPSAPSGPESDTESSTESESESESKSETSDSGSESDVSSVSPQGKAVVPRVAHKERVKVTPKSQPSTFVPPGYGKPQTRSRNLRRRLRRQQEHEVVAVGVSSGGPVSGSNAVAPGDGTQGASGDAHVVPPLTSFSLRNKNKAKNFKSLMNRPLPPKIIFGDEEGVSTLSGATTQMHDPPRLIPPSKRSSLPPNVFVTSVDVEADVPAKKNKRKMGDEYGDELEVDVSLDYGGEEEDVERIEAMANERWDTLAKLTRLVTPGTLVGYKALGIDPVTFTPGQVLSVARVESCDVAVLVVRPLRAVSFNWQEKAEAEEHPWEEIECGDWRVL